MMLSKKTPTTGHLSRKKQKKFALTMLAMALSAIVAPVAFSEEAISDTSIDGDLIWDFVLATDAVSSNILDIDRALLDASLALSDTGIEGIEAKLGFSCIQSAKIVSVTCLV